MSKFSEKAEDLLLDIAEKVDSNKYLTAIKNTFSAFMPFIIVGSFATLFKALISSTTTGLAQWIPILANLNDAFSAINFATMGIMTLPIVFLIAVNLAKANKVPEMITGVVALASYISVVPSVVTVTIDEATGTASAIPSTAVGAQGLFVGMIIAVLVTMLFSWLMKFEKIKIKMPASVPPAIATSFNTLIPIFVTVTITAVVGGIFRNVTGSYLNEWIYKVLQAPMEVVFQSPAGIIAIVIISQLFWFLGIHGGLVIQPIRNPLIAAAVAANIAAVEAGGVATQPITYGFWLNFIVTGGAGMILSLLIAIFIFSKREDHRMIAKLGILPSICGISEPVVFGLPLVLNPTFAIPFIFNSAISTGIALFFTNIGFLPCNTVDCPFGVPVILSAFIGHGWQGVVVQLICIAVATVVWIPFVLVSNKQAEK